MIAFGTCSWTEKTLIESGEFYPKEAKTAEARLRHYASYFTTVEVDSSYYAIPALNTTGLWVERTPDDFIFHIKAYGALTGHGVNPKALPRDIRDELSDKERAKPNIYIKEPDMLKQVFQRFVDVLMPLKQSAKLGVIVFQYPPWFQYRRSNFDYILKCKALMGDLPIAVEFRHGSWLLPDRVKPIMDFLREHDLAYVTADEPQYGTLATVPFVSEVTTDTAYFRFHGRNTENWLKKGIETAQRYNYQYTDAELKEFATHITKADKKAKKTFAMFNNCYMASAIKNALRLEELMKRGKE